MAAKTKINEIPYDWGTLEAGGVGLVLSGIRSATYGPEVEDAKVRGAGREAFDVTPGQGNWKDVQVTLTEATYRAIVDALGDGYMMKKFPLTFSYGFYGQPTIVDELRGCRIKDDAHNPTQGPEGLEVSLTLSHVSGRMNGKNPFVGRPGEGGSTTTSEW